MTTTDVDHAAQPEEGRYTAHIFTPGMQYALGDLTRVRFGSPLRLPNMTNEWPPDILFDIVYAGAILHHFSTRTLKDELTKSWKDILNSEGVTTAAQADHKAVTDKRTAGKGRKDKQAQERNTRHIARHSPDFFDMLMVLPYVKVPQNQLEAVYSEARKKAETMEQERVQEKVDAWAKRVASDCP